MDEPLLETHTPDIVATTVVKPDAAEGGNEGDAATPGKSIAEIKK